MSQISFISFCVENYADYIGKPGNEVYSSFKNSGLLDVLRTDYDDLHGMGMEYMVDFCDKYMRGEVDN